MFRLIFLALPILYLLGSCNPPARTYPARVNTGLDSTEYAGHVEGMQTVDLRKARNLAKFKVGDLGLSIDCSYPEVLVKAKGMARKIGGNLIVVDVHKRFETKSNCHKIIGYIYAVPSLEGLESEISWHPKRPLMPGDLRGKPGNPAAPLPPLACSINCRVGGDYFNEAIIRSWTTFKTDSTYLTADTAFVLRRAQLQFDLAELHARKLKSALAAFGTDLPALTGQYRGLLAREQESLREQAAALDAELVHGDHNAVLTRWEARVQGELSTLDQYFGEIFIDLHVKKK